MLKKVRNFTQLKLLNKITILLIPTRVDNHVIKKYSVRNIQSVVCSNYSYQLTKRQQFDVLFF